VLIQYNAAERAEQQEEVATRSSNNTNSILRSISWTKH
jgi:hypothetical protein